MSRLRTSKIFKATGLVVVAVEQVTVRHIKSNARNYYVYGSIEPIAIMVYTSEGLRVLDMNANLIIFEQLRQNNPELAKLIESFNNT